MTEATAVAESLTASSVELQEQMIVQGDPTPTFQVGDIIACELRGKHDVFIVRELSPAGLIVGSISRQTRLNMRNELATIRPIVLVRLPSLAAFEKVVEGGLYQALDGTEVRVQNRRWVKASDGSEIKLGVIPRVVQRWLPEPPEPPGAAR